MAAWGLSLSQIQVHHPAAKTMIEISRTQDEEVGDGTTSVIILGALVRQAALGFKLFLVLHAFTVLPFHFPLLSPCHSPTQLVRCFQLLSHFWTSRCTQLPSLLRTDMPLTTYSPSAERQSGNHDNQVTMTIR